MCGCTFCSFIHRSSLGKALRARSDNEDALLTELPTFLHENLQWTIKAYTEVGLLGADTIDGCSLALAVSPDAMAYVMRGRGADSESLQMELCTVEFKTSVAETRRAEARALRNDIVEWNGGIQRGSSAIVLDLNDPAHEMRFKHLLPREHRAQVRTFFIAFVPC